MKKFYIPVIFDTVFIAFCLFIFNFIIINYTFNFKITLVLSTMLTMLFSLAVFKFLKKRFDKKNEKQKVEKESSDLVYSLSLKSDEDIIKIFLSAFNGSGLKAVKKNKCIFIENENKFVFTFFSFEQVSKKDVVRIKNLTESKNCTAEIYSDCFSEEIIDFTSAFKNITLKDKRKVYELLLSRKDEIITKKPQSKKIKTLSENFFAKKNAVKFFYFGIFFLINGYFVRIKIYYITVGLIFIVLSLVVRLFGTEK